MKKCLFVILYFILSTHAHAVKVSIELLVNSSQAKEILSAVGVSKYHGFCPFVEIPTIAWI